MNLNPKWKSKRVLLAVGIAAMADLIQLPLTALQLTGIGAAPGEILNVMMGCALMAAISFLIGFHWFMIPTLLAEFVPGVDLIPTWTGCVIFLIGNQKLQQQPPKIPIATVEKAKPFKPLPTDIIDVACEPVEPPYLSSRSNTVRAGGKSIETQLQTLNRLRDQNLISQAEFDEKRLEILNTL
jgi:hypothetical protein